MKSLTQTTRTAATALVFALALGTAAGARAADEQAADRETASKDEVPPPPSVRQRQQFGQTITEYERHGDIFLITVKPRIGPTQYWNDPDGDGQFQRPNSDDIDENMNLPKWRLGGW